MPSREVTPSGDGDGVQTTPRALHAATRALAPLPHATGAWQRERSARLSGPPGPGRRTRDGRCGALRDAEREAGLGVFSITVRELSRLHRQIKARMKGVR